MKTNVEAKRMGRAPSQGRDVEPKEFPSETLAKTSLVDIAEATDDWDPRNDRDPLSADYGRCDYDL